MATTLIETESRQRTKYKSCNLSPKGADVSHSSYTAHIQLPFRAGVHTRWTWSKPNSDLWLFSRCRSLSMDAKTTSFVQPKSWDQPKQIQGPVVMWKVREPTCLTFHYQATNLSMTFFLHSFPLRPCDTPVWTHLIPKWRAPDLPIKNCNQEYVKLAVRNGMHILQGRVPGVIAHEVQCFRHEGDHCRKAFTASLLRTSSVCIWKHYLSSTSPKP